MYISLQSKQYNTIEIRIVLAAEKVLPSNTKKLKLILSKLQYNFNK